MRSCVLGIFGNIPFLELNQNQPDLITLIIGRAFSLLWFTHKQIIGCCFLLNVFQQITINNRFDSETIINIQNKLELLHKFKKYSFGNFFPGICFVKTVVNILRFLYKPRIVLSIYEIPFR